MQTGPLSSTNSSVSARAVPAIPVAEPQPTVMAGVSLEAGVPTQRPVGFLSRLARLASAASSRVGSALGFATPVRVLPNLEEARGRVENREEILNFNPLDLHQRADAARLEIETLLARVNADLPEENRTQSDHIFINTARDSLAEIYRCTQAFDHCFSTALRQRTSLAQRQEIQMRAGATLDRSIEDANRAIEFLEGVIYLRRVALEGPPVTMTEPPTPRFDSSKE